MVQRLAGKDIQPLSVASASIATEVSVTGTSSASPTTCMTIGPFGVDGGQYVLEWYSPYLTIGSTNLDIEVKDGTTFLSTLSGHMAASIARPGTTGTVVLTLGQGNHTLNITAFVDAGTGKFGANNGATGNAPNAWARVYPL